MKKMVVLIVFIIMLIVTGCKNKDETNAIKEENTESVPVNETNNPTKEGGQEEKQSEENKDEDKKEEDDSKENLTRIPLEDLTVGQFANMHISKIHEGRVLYDGFIGASTVISEDKVMVPYEDRTVRLSTGALYCEGYNKEYNTGAMDTLISYKEYMFLKNADMINYSIPSPYTFTDSDMIMTLDVFEEEFPEVYVRDVEYGYSIDDITVNGFICKNNNGYKMIIDPAYMYGIPVYHSNSEFCKYNINGINIEADTLSFQIKCFNEDLKKVLDEIGSSYVYAKMGLSSLSCRFSIETGYDSEAYLYDYELISKDTEEILTSKASFEDALNKDPKAIETYNTIMANSNTLNTDSAIGMVLLDLDFDGSPELLVSRCSDNWDDLYANHNVQAIEVDIYRIESDGLLYIDTLWNYHGMIDGFGNVLGLKTLEDGSKAWFNMSYKDRNRNEVSDTDYLFTLEGNKLNFEEIFGVDAEGNYCYMGEPMIFEEEPYSDEMYPDHTIYYWNGYKGFYGKWEIFGFVKEDYCKDMENSTFNLYSDWMSYWNSWEKPNKMLLTDRMLSYNIAYLVDSYYFGDYDINKQYYVYTFLGGYAKPVIYLYPTEKIDVSVKIDINGKLTCTYPEYGNGWHVTANPDGTLINKADGREYSYLFWEGEGPVNWDFSKGFVVKGEDTLTFLQDKLEYMGLNTKEMNEFIVYWLPLMKHNKYNLISFQTEEYEKNAKLNILPQPDSVLRIFMTYRPIEKHIEIPEQKLEKFNREGFTVIEWGGSLIESEKK